MKIVRNKRKNKAAEEFHKSEWRIQDWEYYGADFEWYHEDFTLVAKEGRKIIGVVEFYIDEDVAYVDSLIVAKDFRGQGIGKKLMQEMEALVTQKNCHKIHLVTGKGWPTEGFYQSLGFKKAADLPRHFRKIDFVDYTKFLK